METYSYQTFINDEVVSGKVEAESIDEAIHAVKQKHGDVSIIEWLDDSQPVEG